MRPANHITHRFKRLKHFRSRLFAWCDTVAVEIRGRFALKSERPFDADNIEGPEIIPAGLWVRTLILPRRLRAYHKTPGIPPIFQPVSPTIQVQDIAP